MVCIRERRPASVSDSSAVDLRFEYRDSAGIHAVKEFHLDPASYIFSFRADVTENDQPIAASIVWGPAIGDITELSRGVKKSEGILFQDGKVVRLAAKDIAKQSVYDGQFHYAGVEDNYFMVAALATDPIKVTFAPVSISAAGRLQGCGARSHHVHGRATRRRCAAEIFAGPKDFDVLKRSIPISLRPSTSACFRESSYLLTSLKWVYRYVGNYGWAIILLTFIINVILFPLRHKSVVSMRKMQEIQPEVKAIQERYKNLKATDRRSRR
jgi:YidC/Oxa1 family membrane protein insertase